MPPPLQFNDERSLLTALLQRAAYLGASDIHFQPGAQPSDNVTVRLRIDGQLSAQTDATQQPTQLPPELYQALLAQLKTRAGLDIAVTRSVQEGRLRIQAQGQKQGTANAANNGGTSLRLSLLPTPAGQSAVLRILKEGAGQLGLHQLGLSAPHVGQLKNLLNQPEGLVLVTGPTGSGKTSTLYALLKQLNAQQHKIVTLEDPVEATLPGALQTSVRAHGGVNFASGLKAILRQSPDVILVGEIRDSETAAIAVQAALSGHLVFSTLHTRTSVGAVQRLIQLGVAPYRVAAALRAVIAQRLVRKLAAEATQPYTPPPGVLETLQRACTARGTGEDEAPPAFLHAQGTQPPFLPQQKLPALQTPNMANTPNTTTVAEPEAAFHAGGAGSLEALKNAQFLEATCQKTGYAGRLGVFELLQVTPALEQHIAQNVSAENLYLAAVAEGFTPMLADALVKAAAGHTSLNEVLGHCL